jgi:hypothetical protein
LSGLRVGKMIRGAAGMRAKARNRLLLTPRPAPLPPPGPERLPDAPPCPLASDYDLKKTRHMEPLEHRQAHTAEIL